MDLLLEEKAVRHFAGRPKLLRKKLFYQTCSTQRLVYTSLLHRFKAFCGDIHSDFSIEFRHEDRLLLDIHEAAPGTGRVEFGRTRAI